MATTQTSITPQLYTVTSGSYDDNWVHTPEAELVTNYYPNEIFGLSPSITIEPTSIPYCGNTYCQWITEGKVCKLSMQIDLDCSANTSILYQQFENEQTTDEFRIQCLNPYPATFPSPKQFPVVRGEPLLKCNIVILNNGQPAISSSNVGPNHTIDYYVRLLKDGTMALVQEKLLYFNSQTVPPVTYLSAVTIGDIAPLLGFWQSITNIGIAICVEDTFLLV